MQNQRYKVLFICPDNAVHSIIAEALLKRWGGNDFCASGAGTKPRGAIDPRTLELLKEQRLWHPRLRSKGHQEFLGPGRASPGFCHKSRRARSRRRVEAMAGESASHSLAHHQCRHVRQTGRSRSCVSESVHRARNPDQAIRACV